MHLLHENAEHYPPVMNQSPPIDWFTSTSGDSANSDFTTAKSYIINSSNYHRGIPDGVTNVLISDHLDQSLYKQIFHVNVNVHNERGRPMGEGRINVTLHDLIIEIKDEAFFNCNLIKSITMPKKVKRIGSNAFQYCEYLELIKLPKYLEVIGEAAFSRCKRLKSVVLPDTLKTLGNNAFANCDNLRSVILSKSLTSIDEYAFRGCWNLHSISIPEGVTVIEKSAFYMCPSLQSIILPQSLHEIKEDAFGFCRILTSIVIPDSLNTIEENAFNRCTMLQNIIIPKSCTYQTRHTKNIINNKLDVIIKERGQDWLKHRFDDLPLHQLCSKKNITMDEIVNISANHPFLNSVDALNMTALHVLSCNPYSTLEMIRALASKYPEAAFVETKNSLFPLELYLLTKNIVQGSLNRFHIYIDYSWNQAIRDLMKKGSLYNIHDLLKTVLIKYDHNLWDIILSFQGTSIDIELSKYHQNTKFYPFMTAAISQTRPLDVVYTMAMSDPILIAKEKKRTCLISENSIHSNKRIRTCGN